METKDTPVTYTAFRYSLYTAAALAAYRVVAGFVNFGIMGSPEVLNVLILACGIFAAIRHYHRRLKHPLPYQSGFALGMLTALLSMVGYAVFVFFYFTFADPSYLRQALHYPAADEPNALEIAATALIEGIMYGVIITLAAVEYYTVDRTNKNFDEAYE